jgi:predicted metal-dependent phosphoesterase TrpH
LKPRIEARRLMHAAELTTEEENVVGAIAALEASGRTTSLCAVAERAGLSAEATRTVLSRLLGNLGLVQELEGDDVGVPERTPERRPRPP